MPDVLVMHAHVDRQRAKIWMLESPTFTVTLHSGPKKITGERSTFDRSVTVAVVDCEWRTFLLCTRDIPIQPAGSEPAVAVRFELDLVVTMVHGTAVVGPEQVDEQRRATDADRDANGAGLVGKVVQHDQRMVAPRVLHDEHIGGVSLEDLPVPPADLGALFPHP